MNPLLIKPMIYGGLALLVTLGGAWSLHAHNKRVHDEGFAECRQQVDQALAEANARADAAEQKLREQRSAATLEIAQIRAARSTGRAAAKKSVDAHPDFAVVERPPELHAQRQRELEEWRKAATGR